nr:hypothetical protein [Burkholderia savannae]
MRGFQARPCRRSGPRAPRAPHRIRLGARFVAAPDRTRPATHSPSPAATDVRKPKNLRVVRRVVRFPSRTCGRPSLTSSCFAPHRQHDGESDMTKEFVGTHVVGPREKFPAGKPWTNAPLTVKVPFPAALPSRPVVVACALQDPKHAAPCPDTLALAVISVANTDLTVNIYRTDYAGADDTTSGRGQNRASPRRRPDAASGAACASRDASAIFAQMAAMPAGANMRQASPGVGAHRRRCARRRLPPSRSPRRTRRAASHVASRTACRIRSQNQRSAIRDPRSARGTPYRTRRVTRYAARRR